MTPDERFTRIENLLETVAEHQAVHDQTLTRLATTLTGLATTVEGLATTVERVEVGMETSSHEQNLKIQQLMAFQTTLMESGDRSWRAIEMLGARVDRVTENLDRLIRFHGSNGGEKAN